MEQLTGLGKAIVAADPDKIRLDMTVKNILAYKPLLSRIFKEVVSGYSLIFLMNGWTV